MSNPDTDLPGAVSSGGVLTTIAGSQRIATRMAENLLGVARNQERALAAQRRQNLDDYECEQPKYLSHEQKDEQVDNGIDPEILMVGAKLGALYVVKGAVKFAQWAKVFVDHMQRLGVDLECVKPTLKEIYAATSVLVDEETADRMDDLRTVHNFDLSKIGADPNAPAQPAGRIDIPAQSEAEKIFEGLESLQNPSPKEAIQWTLGAERACVHINAGIRNFSDYARAMTEEIGDQIQPYLLCFWEAARRWPGLDVAGMTNSEDSSREHQALLNRTCALKQTFDEEIYNKAKPLFQQAIANIDKPSSDLKEAMRAVVQMVLEKSGAEAAHNMKPYVVRFISEQQSPVV